MRVLLVLCVFAHSWIAPREVQIYLGDYWLLNPTEETNSPEQNTEEPPDAVVVLPTFTA
jgi:hypothetical protein